MTHFCCLFLRQRGTLQMSYESFFGGIFFFYGQNVAHWSYCTICQFSSADDSCFGNGTDSPWKNTSTWPGCSLSLYFNSMLQTQMLGCTSKKHVLLTRWRVYAKLCCWISSDHLYIVPVVDSLTNDESRKNWETYGNPDGPRGKWTSSARALLRIV